MSVTKTFEIDMYLQLIENELEEAFPNVTIMFKIYLCMFARVFKTETFKKHYGSGSFAIENELLKTIDFSDIITDFADAKSRRKNM